MKDRSGRTTQKALKRSPVKDPLEEPPKGAPWGTPLNDLSHCFT